MNHDDLSYKLLAKRIDSLESNKAGCMVWVVVLLIVYLGLHAIDRINDRLDALEAKPVVTPTAESTK